MSKEEGFRVQGLRLPGLGLQGFRLVGFRVCRALGFWGLGERVVRFRVLGHRVRTLKSQKEFQISQVPMPLHLHVSLRRLYEAPVEIRNTLL